MNLGPYTCQLKSIMITVRLLTCSSFKRFFGKTRKVSYLSTLDQKVCCVKAFKFLSHTEPRSHGEDQRQKTSGFTTNHFKPLIYDLPQRSKRLYPGFPRVSVAPCENSRYRFYSTYPFITRDIPSFIKYSPKFSRYPSFFPVNFRYVNTCFL